MAPVDGGAQRLLPGRRGPVAGGEQLEPISKALRDLVCRQGPDPSGGQLDRERNAVKRAADRRDAGGVGRAELKAGMCRGGAVGEQAHRLVAAEHGHVSYRIRRGQ